MPILALAYQCVRCKRPAEVMRCEVLYTCFLAAQVFASAIIYSTKPDWVQSEI